MMQGIYIYIHVTGFERTRLPRTQQQEYTFHHHTIAVHTS